MNIDNVNAAYNSGVFVFYLWLSSFVVPIVFPLQMPVTDSVIGINIVLVPSLVFGALNVNKVLKSKVLSDILAYIGVPSILIISGVVIRVLGI